ncbi:leucine ABC transporter subunit substrate-binding protein LivK [Raoultella planticola]|uniref:Leucine ABC transporter subunit substrate-binding protein LivK n=1 Tax=Raoultella planticola TaxID=575 RepID=A0A485A749_RAOPL|nr:leucine ABC transporter subunit substrate-binding protein LivK [Raoultella planticola]
MNHAASNIIKSFRTLRLYRSHGLLFQVYAADTIKVGIMHSLSGTMAISETPLKDVALMAIDDINAKGGVLGKKLEPVVVDPASNWPLFAEKSPSAANPGQGGGGLWLLDIGLAKIGSAGF